MYGPWVRVPAGSLRKFHFTSEALRIDDPQGFFVSIASVYLASPYNLIHQFVTKPKTNLVTKIKKHESIIDFYPNTAKKSKPGKIPLYVRVGCSTTRSVLIQIGHVASWLNIPSTEFDFVLWISSTTIIFSPGLE
jgi:hypothetical protein